MSINQKALEQAKEWLRKWDANELVWTIEMGGLGPGYEQCIQITTAEVLRWLIDNKSDPANWKKNWQEESDKISKHVMQIKAVKDLRLSGAQYGGAVNLASVIYKRGTDAMNDAEVRDRRIQVQRVFPQAT